mmetsp:Transcript_98142/g.262083  ORF Transcript_98142/g.262083 Transcript_98142/m.262083 type:complete len:115 (+) Transcript_98142:59-403(+)
MGLVVGTVVRTTFILWCVFVARSPLVVSHACRCDCLGCGGWFPADGSSESRGADHSAFRCPSGEKHDDYIIDDDDDDDHCDHPCMVPACTEDLQESPAVSRFSFAAESRGCGGC